MAALLLSLIMSVANAGGFKNGNLLRVAAIEGRVTVFCPSIGGTNTAVYACRDRVMEPAAYDYFVGPLLNSAKKYSVELTATSSDGSIRAKSEDYLPSKGLSEEKFNLWISSLFQKPLLKTGINRIDYKIMDSDGRVEVVGDFQANVVIDSPRTCPSTSYTSADVQDCSSQYSVCQQYFQQYNFCK